MQSQNPGITIFHNPACGTSRNTLALIRNSGAEPEVIEYLKTPPSRATLQSLVRAMGISVRELLRRKGTPYDELQLDDPQRSDDELLDAMLAHPILINRPIVSTRASSPSASVARRSVPSDANRQVYRRPSAETRARWQSPQKVSLTELTKPISPRPSSKR